MEDLSKPFDPYKLVYFCIFSLTFRLKLWYNIHCHA